MENLFQEIVFWLLAAVTVGAALLVVHTTNMFRAALLLVGAFLGIAGLFALMFAEFVAVVQVLIYGGGIAVLIIFAVMITRDVETGNRATPVQPVALMLGVVLLTALVYAITQAQWQLLPDDLPEPLAAVFVDTPSRLGHLLLSDYVLAFEIAGVLLMAVVIGALALVRER
ncbi:MAG: NADH-quinone oxidoreductase subunit J [Dehalococcoidia bacterium]